MRTLEIIEERRLIKSLVIVITALVSLNIINQLLGYPSWQITRLIDLGVESNFPTWFSSMLLAIAAFFAYGCSVLAKTKEAGKRMWQLLSLGLLGMSCDETAMIHENLGNTINKYLFRLENLEHSSWVVFLGPFIVLIIGVFAINMKKYLSGSTRAIKLFIVGMLVYIAGAFILESTTNFLNHDTLEWLWRIEIIFEESCEMIGILIIISGLIEHQRFMKAKNGYK